MRGVLEFDQMDEKAGDPGVGCGDGGAAKAVRDSTGDGL